MTFRALLFFSLLGFHSVASAQEAKVRTSLGTRGDLWVGERVTLVVELLAPGFFSGVASFDLPNAPGLLLAPPAGSPTISSEAIDGMSYTVQRHEVSVFARRGGGQTLPPFTVRFQFKRNPLDKDSVAATVKTEPVQFRVKVPPGAEKLGNVISARNLKVEETWHPEPGKAKTGDAFTRTITYSAPDVPAMAFPPFPGGSIDGLGTYPKPPEVLDENDRGKLTGKRRDTITYICQRAGRFEIPAARLTWFDLDTQQLQTIDFPARTFDVAPNPAMAGASPPQPPVVAANAWNSALLRSAFGAVVLGVSALLVPARWWRRAVAPLRPVHLAPLNPTEKNARQ